MAASVEYVRIIVRRPHAYTFQAKHKGTPIPGFVIVDSEGAVRGAHDLRGESAARDLAELLNKSK